MLFIGHYKTSDKNFPNNRFYLFDNEDELDKWLRKYRSHRAYPACAEEMPLNFEDYLTDIPVNQDFFENHAYVVCKGYKMKEKEWEETELYARRKAKSPIPHYSPDGVMRNGYRRWEDLIELKPEESVDWAPF